MLAIMAILAIIIVYVWRNLGYATAIYIAGLQAIPHDLYEAARVDGAGAWARLRHVTLPGLSPVMFFLVVTSILSSFQAFDIINVMTQGGPVNGWRRARENHVVHRRSSCSARRGYDRHAVVRSKKDDGDGTSALAQTNGGMCQNVDSRLFIEETNRRAMQTRKLNPPLRPQPAAAARPRSPTGASAAAWATLKTSWSRCSTPGRPRSPSRAKCRAATK